MTDVFAGETPPEELKVEDVIGEQGRYKTQDDAAKALIEKDRFIQQLQREAQEAREALQKRINEEEVLTRMEALARKSPEPEEQPRGRDETTAVAAVTPELIQQEIMKVRARERAETNLEAVQRTLAEVYGPEWKAKVQAKAAELGVGTQYLSNLGAESPKLLFSALGIEQKKPAAVSPQFAPPTTQRNMSAQPVNPNVRDYAYWQEQAKAKGDAWYFSLPVQQEIWKDVKTMGEDQFYARTKS